MRCKKCNKGDVMKYTALFVLMMIPAMVAGKSYALTAPVGAPPSPAELALPTSAAPAAPVAAAVTTTTTTPAPAGRTQAAHANTSTGMPNDPCPNLKGAVDNAPDDMAQVQEDIDRFTLCVQRGQLLERLNDTSTKSIEGTDAALGLGNGSGGGLGMGGALPTNMPPLPANALGGADVSPSAAPPASAGASTSSAPSSSSSASTDDTSDSASRWTIKEVFGSTVDMQARLLSPDGDEVKVKKGTKLPDSSVVISVSPDGVNIRGSKGVKALEWTKS